MKSFVKLLLEEIDNSDLKESEKVLLTITLLEKRFESFDEDALKLSAQKIFEHIHDLEEWKQYDVLDSFFALISKRKEVFGEDLAREIINMLGKVKNVFLKYRLIQWTSEYFAEHIHLIKPESIFSEGDIYFSLLSLSQILKHHSDKKLLTFLKKHIDKTIYIVNPGDRERAVRNILDALKHVTNPELADLVASIIKEIIEILNKIGDSHRQFNVIRHIIDTLNNSSLLEKKNIVEIIKSILKKVDKIDNFFEYVSSNIEILGFLIEKNLEVEIDKIIENIVNNIYKIGDLKDKGIAYANALNSLSKIDKTAVTKLINTINNDVNIQENESKKFLLLGYFLDHIDHETIKNVGPELSNSLLETIKSLNDRLFKVSLKVKMLGLIGSSEIVDGDSRNTFENLLNECLEEMSGETNDVYIEKVSEILGKTLNRVNTELLALSLEKLKRSKNINYGVVLRNLVLSLPRRAVKI
ncbi:MAG: hypothetical protein ACP6IP_04405 [Candidatus Njordarchaeia archaeon]